MSLQAQAAKKKFLFSAIIPVYNKEEYLDEAMKSLINQTVGFVKNIQVILINDGSTDNSAKLCEAYANSYPENVSFFNQENKGVSAARNVGLRHAEGDLITFFDADDIWDLDAFEKASAFLCTHKEIDVVSARLVQFGDITADHVLDYKYKNTCVVDLNIHPDYVQPMIGNCFFRSQALKERYFNENRSYAEDTLFVNSILLDKLAYGILADTAYHYRKVRAANTASMSVKKKRYFDNNAVYISLYTASNSKLGFVHAFITRCALYELCWQIFVRCSDPFSPNEQVAWYDNMHTILSAIPDSVISSARWLNISKRICLLKLKHNNSFFDHVAWTGTGTGYFDGTKLFSLKSLPCIVIDRMQVHDSCLKLEGITQVTFLNENAHLNIKTEQDTIPLQLVPFPALDKTLITGEKLLHAYRFSINVPIGQVIGKHLSFTWQQSPSKTLSLPIRSTLYGGLPCKRSYFTQDGIIIKKTSSSALKVMRDRFRTHAASEFRMCKSILELSNLSHKTKLSLIGIRITSKVYRTFKKKPIWIFVDREYKAGDNAEALFSYLKKQSELKNIDMNFLLQQSSKDYPRLRSMGSVLQPKTLKFYIKFLSAEKILSGHHDQAVTNPFGKEGKYFADMYQYKFYNLSHGTLQGDLSSQLNKHVRPIHRFVVSANMEKKALLCAEYGYTNEEVALAGMCRYDMYDNARKKEKIIFLPTWRASLAGAIIPGTREREYIPDFDKSDYCQTYNELINNEKLLAILKKHGYTGEFYVHPNYEKQTRSFHGNDIIAVGEASADYTDILSEGALLISDYSGITFDFAYLRKPVIYFQFDDLFNGDHSYQERYFDYSAQGFGPVCHNSDEVVSAIESFLVSDCKMGDKYQARADEFFSFSDRLNCQRVAEIVTKQ